MVLDDYITYDQKMFENIIAVLATYQLMGIEQKGILLEESRYQNLLEILITEYVNLKADLDRVPIIPTKLDLKSVLELADYSFISILPKYWKTILKYDGLLYSHDDFPFYTANFEYRVTKKGKIRLHQIALSSDINEYTPGVINHEKMHALMMKKIHLSNFPIIYMELLSILMQKITNYQVEKVLNISTIHIMDEIIRAFENQQHLSILVDIFKDIDLEKESVNNHFVYQFLNLKANDYLLSDWYSDILMEYYLIDFKTLQKKLFQLFSNEITIQELLNYYDVSLDHKNFIPNIEKKLAKIKKYSIQQ